MSWDPVSAGNVAMVIITAIALIVVIDYRRKLNKAISECDGLASDLEAERERLGYCFAKGYSPIFDTVTGEWMMRDITGGDIVRAKDPRNLLDQLLANQAQRADEYEKNKELASE